MMRLRVLSVKNPGDIEQERVIMIAEERCNIGNYLLFDSMFTNARNSSDLIRHPFVFPSLFVLRGDYVVLYTKQGKERSSHRMDGDNIEHCFHFFYWGLEEPIWKPDGSQGFLVHSLERDAFTIGGPDDSTPGTT